MSMCSYAYAGRADEHVLMSNYEHVLIRSSHKIAPDMILKIEQNQSIRNSSGRNGP
jgi:hypothetical protein